MPFISCTILRMWGAPINHSFPRGTPDMVLKNTSEKSPHALTPCGPIKPLLSHLPANLRGSLPCKSEPTTPVLAGSPPI